MDIAGIIGAILGALATFWAGYMAHSRRMDKMAHKSAEEFYETQNTYDSKLEHDLNGLRLDMPEQSNPTSETTGSGEGLSDRERLLQRVKEISGKLK